MRLPPALGASASVAWGWITARASHAATRAPDLTVPLGAALTSRSSGIYSSPGAYEPPLPAPVPLQSRCGVQPPGPACCSAGARASGTPRAVPGMAMGGGVWRCGGLGSQTGSATLLGAQTLPPSHPVPTYWQVLFFARCVSPP